MRKIVKVAGLLLLVNGGAFAQHATLHYGGENEVSERKTIMRSLVTMKDSEETIFWPLYSQYEQRVNDPNASSLYSVEQIRNLTPEKTLSDNIQQIFENQYEDVRLKKEFFDKINQTLNGTVAFTFLQSEALTELMQKSRLYETLSGESLNWDKGFIRDEQLKLDELSSILKPSPEIADKLKTLISDFEFEYSRVVGHQFVWFEQYVEEVQGLTPAQCQQMGTEFLAMQFNEVKVREQFFRKIAAEAGEDLAARFIALDDYFNMMAKLKTWSDVVLAAR